MPSTGGPPRPLGCPCNIAAQKKACPHLKVALKKGTLSRERSRTKIEARTFNRQQKKGSARLGVGRAFSFGVHFRSSGIEFVSHGYLHKYSAPDTANRKKQVAAIKVLRSSLSRTASMKYRALMSAPRLITTSRAKSSTAKGLTLPSQSSRYAPPTRPRRTQPRSAHLLRYPSSIASLSAAVPRRFGTRAGSCRTRTRSSPSV
jgi:hypothetical protein